MHILRHLGRLLREFPFEKERIKKLQLKKLKRLLIHSYKNFEFYRERFDGCGLDPRHIKNVEELQKLPVLTEAEYRTFADSEYGKHPDRYKDCFFDTTSGTTGVPFQIVRTWNERAYMVAKYLRPLILNGLRWHDLSYRIIAPTRIPEMGDSRLQHLGLFRRKLVPFTATVEEMVRAYQEVNPDFFYANKQQLLMTAYYLLDHDIQIRKPRICSAAADIIEENCRQLIYRAFGKDGFFETYGSNELGTLGFQITAANDYHYCHDTGLLELLDEDGYPSREAGNCLITDFEIKSFPLIRFQLGDYLELSEEAGGVRKIKKIWGRLHDSLSWEDGSKTRLADFIKIMERYALEICQFQIIQENYRLIKILAVRAPGIVAPQKSENAISQEMIAAFKTEVRPGIEFRVEFVPLIPAAKNGKVKMAVSNLNK